jgi:hypothetical protein
MFLAKPSSLQTLRGFRHDLFLRVSRGAVPFLQVWEAEVPVFGKTTQGGEGRGEGREVGKGGEVEAERKGEGRDKEDGVEGGPQIGAEGKAQSRGRRWTVAVPRFNVNRRPCGASEVVGESRLLGRHQSGQ